MSDVTTPQFAIPFRFDGATAVVVEQDTDEEIRSCVETVMRYRQGQREELPGFGVVDQTFLQGPTVDLAPYIAAAEKWEPRATALATAENITIEQLVSEVTVRVESEGA